MKEVVRFVWQKLRRKCQSNRKNGVGRRIRKCGPIGAAALAGNPSVIQHVHATTSLEHHPQDPTRIALNSINMIIPGRTALQRRIIENVRSASQQVQPCGVDLTLKRVMTWQSKATIDFDNQHRKTAKTTEFPFLRDPGAKINITEPLATTLCPNSSQSPGDVDSLGTADYVDLDFGSYLVEFNEKVNMPLDVMGQILVRSSLFRSGALVHAGVMDSGYKGVVGAMLQVVNPHGLRLLRDAKLAQMIFQQMSEPVEGYSGVYQGRTFV